MLKHQTSSVTTTTFDSALRVAAPRPRPHTKPAPPPIRLSSAARPANSVSPLVMPKTRAQRRRSAARRPTEPTSPSPPQTPTTTSPSAGRKAPPYGRIALKQSPTVLRKSSAPKNLRPLGGTSFSYSRNLRPEDLSPASSEDDEDEGMHKNKFDVLGAGPDESDDAEDEKDSDDDMKASDDDEEDSEDSEEDSEEDSDSGSDSDEEVAEEEGKDEEDAGGDGVQGLFIPPSPPAPPVSHHAPPPYMEYSRITTTKITTKIIIVADHLIIEDLGEYEYDTDDGEVITPYAIECPEPGPTSKQQQQQQQQPSRRRDLDPAFQRNFADLNPFDTSDDDMDENDEFEANRRKAREERRLRRMKSGSISKRTVSERGSDSDREDVPHFCQGEFNDSGPAYRRTRRKTDRHSMQFSGQFPESIEELKEPSSDDEIIFEDTELYARELPFWTLMDVDSE